MKFRHLFFAFWLTTGALAAAEQTMPGTSSITTTGVSASVAAKGNMAAAPLPESRRTFVLVMGVAAVAVAFHRGITGRRQPG